MSKICVLDLNPDEIMLRTLEPCLRYQRFGFSHERVKLGLGEKVPRKIDFDYARYLYYLIGRIDPLFSQIIYVGDGDLDAEVIRNFGKLTGNVYGFICNKDFKAEDKNIYFADSWEELPLFLEQFDLVVDEHTILFTDWDKTLFGARGKNSDAVDSARLDAAKEIARETLSDKYDDNRFSQIYEKINNPKYFHFTGDNQDITVFMALVELKGLCDIDEVCHKCTFAEFIEELASSGDLKMVIESINDAIARSDSTLFKSFRFKENIVTQKFIKSGELEYNKQVVEFVQMAKKKGAKYILLSDKPFDSVIMENERPLYEVRGVVA